MIQTPSTRSAGDSTSTIEPNSLDELFGNAPSPTYDTVGIGIPELRIEFERQLKEHGEDRTIFLENEKLSQKERKAALTTSNTISGLMIVWSLIGVVMLGRSCVNTDPGPKFKV